MKNLINHGGDEGGCGSCGKVGGEGGCGCG